MQLLVKKVNTSWAPVGENKGAYFLRREIMWGFVQWKKTCCSSWTSSVSHRFKVGELLRFHVAVSKRRVGVNTKSETSCTANDFTRQVEKHVFGKDVRRMSDQSPFGRKRTINWWVAFAFVIFRMSRIRCPVLQVSLPEVYNKMAEINGFTVLQLLLKIYDCVRPSMAERIWAPLTLTPDSPITGVST